MSDTPENEQPIPESEPEGAEVAQPTAATEGERPPEPTSDTQGTDPPAEAPQQDDPGTGDAEGAGITEPKAGTAPAVDPAPDATAPEQPAAAEPDAADEPDVPTAAPAHDELRTPVLELLTEKLGDAVLASELVPGSDIWARVRLDAWAEAALVLRDAGFSYFCFLSAIDWLPSPYGKSEDDSAPADVDPNGPLDHGVTGGETRFQLLARVEKPGTDLGVTLKADVGDDLVAPTWTGVYAGANWHERETWEMFGITFAGHPYLVHLYLPGDFEGNPLRKDFPLLARMVKPWPGLVDVEPMPGEEADDEAEAAAE